MIKVTIYNEGRHDKHDHIKAIYPTGMHGAIKECLEASGDIQATTITLDEVLENGFSDELLNETDVLFWWGHVAHAEVPDELVDRVQKRVLEGMGLVVLHSGHFSKVFKRLMGTGCNLKWRETGDRERIWTTAPHHPIAAGLPDGFMLPKEETYGEHFDIPQPDETVFISWFSGGEVFRSGCTFHRGNGKIFYFRPGHESFPTFYDENVKKVLVNAAHWANSEKGIFQFYGHYPSPETGKLRENE